MPALFSIASHYGVEARLLREESVCSADIARKCYNPLAARRWGTAGDPASVPGRACGIVALGHEVICESPCRLRRRKLRV